MTYMPRFLIWLTVCCLICTACFAEGVISQEQGKVWNIQDANIRTVIGEVANITGKNFIIDPRVKGKISIVSGSKIKDSELYPLFLSMLQVSGFAAIPGDNAVKIIPNQDAKSQITSYDTGDAITMADSVMVQVIPVKFVPAEQLVPVLRPLMPQWGNVSAYSPSNMLILSGKANNIRQLANIIQQVDSSAANDIDIVPLKHTLAMDIANTLKDLVKNPTTGYAQSKTMLAADDRNNSILISGSQTERLRLRLLIQRLDKRSPNAGDSNTQVVYLNYLRAEDLVPILAGIAQANFSGTVGSTIGTSTRPELDSTNPNSSLVTNLSPNPQNTSNATPNPPDKTSNGGWTQNEGTGKPSVQIIGEPNTNSIILNAPPTLIRTLKSVISQLDIQPAQLLMEAIVTEINENDFKSLGIEWGSVPQTSDDTSTFRPGLAIINSKTTVDQLQAQIYALAQQKKANILSTPSVVVLDNRQAKILIGKQVSVASSSYPNNAGGTAASGSPFTTFDRVNVALHLYVRPQITRGKGIQIQIDQGNDTLDSANTTNPGPNPTFNISSIVTSVHVESGDIIVLGGLSQDSLGNDNNRIPILGDIPGLGKLFQHNITSHEKKVLMVFIRPVILHNEQEGIQITNTKYRDLRQYQLDWMRTQEYSKDNNASVLSPLQQAKIPVPFTAKKVCKI